MQQEVSEKPSLPVLRKWYKIRDMFLGREGQKQNIALALISSKSCLHPDSQFLHFVWEENRHERWISTIRQRLEAYSDKDDPRILCWIGMIQPLTSRNCVEYRMIERSAEMGYALAQAIVGAISGRMDMLNKAIEQGERDAYLVKARLQSTPEDERFDLMDKAATLGSGRAIDFFQKQFKRNDPRCWYYRSKHTPALFMEKFHGDLNARKHKCAIMIGQICKENINDSSVFDIPCGRKKLTSVYKFIRYYNDVLATRIECQLWLLWSRKMGIYKDVRIMIGKAIWSLLKSL
jgi:hypothetical protein